MSEDINSLLALTVGDLRALMAAGGEFDSDEDDSGWYSYDLDELAEDLAVETCEIRRLCVDDTGRTIDEDARVVEYVPAPGDIVWTR